MAASPVGKQEAPKAVAKVIMDVSAGMALGVPAVGYRANVTSLRVGMLSLTAVTAAVLLATLVLIPSMPVREKLSCGARLGVLKKRSAWMALFAVVFLNGAIFGAYSFFAGFPQDVIGLCGRTASILLLVYGLANIIGNMIAGRQLSRNAALFCCRALFFLP